MNCSRPRFKFADETLELGKTDDKSKEKAVDMIRDGTGKNLTDKVRVKVAELETTEKELLARREKDAQ